MTGDEVCHQGGRGYHFMCIMCLLSINSEIAFSSLSLSMEANVIIVKISESHLWSFCTQNNVDKNSWTPTNRMPSPRGSQKYIVGKRCTVLPCKVFQGKKINTMRDKWPLGRISGVKFYCVTQVRSSVQLSFPLFCSLGDCLAIAFISLLFFNFISRAV